MMVFLQKLYNVQIAKNGKQGLQILKTQEIHLIISDVMMPVMDGFEASKKIRASKELGKLSEIPIIALTASAMAGDKDKCFSAGMNDYLTKPLDRDLLKRTLQKWLN